MHTPADSIAARVLGRLSNAVYRCPRLFLYPQLFLVIASILITAVKPKIQFDTSRDDLVGADKPYHKNYLRYKKELALLETNAASFGLLPVSLAAEFNKVV